MRFVSIFTISLSIFPLFLFAQVEFNIGPKIGISVAHLPTNSEKRILETDFVTRANYSTIGPVLGISSQLILWNHLELTAGIQYQNTNRKSSYNKDGRIPRDFDIPEWYTYTTVIQEEQSFNKITFPFTIGFTSNIWNINPSIYLGFNPNFFLNGKYYYESTLDASDDTRDKSRKIEFNPTSADEAFLPVRRINNQFIIGISIQFKKPMKVDLSYSTGRRVQYSQFEQFLWEPYFIFFRNSDLTLNYTYYLKKN